MSVTPILILVIFKILPIFSANHKFPDDFQFGVATSAYQIEGGSESRGETVLDYFQKLDPSIIKDKSNASIACDSYHRYEEDITLLNNLGVDFYRFSIAWTRVLPSGHPNRVNPDAIRYYNSLIDGLLAKKIQPVVTIYHDDLPKVLRDLGGWTNPILSDIFMDYCHILFENFGDRVKYWITFHTIFSSVFNNDHIPTHKQPGIEEYLIIKNTLLAHAKAYRLYESNYKKEQNGKIGFVADGFWYQPASASEEDLKAAERAWEFAAGLMLNPIYGSGDFPKLVKERVEGLSLKQGFFRSRLPQLTLEEVRFIKGTYDFLGLNIYTTLMVKNDPEGDNLESCSYHNDRNAVLYQEENWPTAKSFWLKVVPWGVRKALTFFKNKYNDPPIFITENGFSDEGQLDDTGRINFLKSYLKEILDAIHEDGVRVRWYAVWSLLDNFEWLAGYSERFGLHHVDFDDPLRKRTPKASAVWYKSLIQRRQLEPVSKTEL